MPQPISTAPQDGTVIMTEEGFVRWSSTQYWHRKGWVSCDPSGYEFECADNGTFPCEPKQWEPVPEWISPKPSTK